MVAQANSFTVPSDGYLLVKPKNVAVYYGSGDYAYYTVIPSISIAGNSVQGGGRTPEMSTRSAGSVFVAPVASGNAIVVSSENGGVYFIPKY